MKKNSSNHLTKRFSEALLLFQGHNFWACANKKVMKNSKRNISDRQQTVDPEKSAKQKTEEANQKKASVDEVYSENDSLKKEKQAPRDNPNKRERNAGLDVNLEG
jgi:hypothetical protein